MSEYEIEQLTKMMAEDEQEKKQKAKPRANSSDAKAATAQNTEAESGKPAFTIDGHAKLRPLKLLMKCICVNERTMTFFANLPAPTYQH